MFRRSFRIPLPGLGKRPSTRSVAVRRLLALTAVAIGILTPVFYFRDVPIGDALSASAFFVGTCVLFGCIFWRVLTGRRPSSKASTWSRLARHVFAAMLFGAGWTLTFTALILLVRPVVPVGFLKDGAIWQLIWGMAIYGALAWTAWLQARLSDRELAATQAELQALRAQLNPHFLFNTLHSLTQLAREDPAATERALERFGDLMRYVLATGRDADGFTLKDELVFVRNYLALEQMRFADRLKVIEDVDACALDCSFPPLLLQPLVENAVRHGIAPRKEGGTIRVAAYELDGALVVEVADDGCGSRDETWRNAEGLGLRIIERQLSARYAAAAELEVETEPNEGFVVRIGIPASRETQVPWQ